MRRKKGRGKGGSGRQLSERGREGGGGRERERERKKEREREKERESKKGGEQQSEKVGSKGAGVRECGRAGETSGGGGRRGIKKQRTPVRLLPTVFPEPQKGKKNNASCLRRRYGVQLVALVC
jgi:hypothetical protein